MSAAHTCRLPGTLLPFLYPLSNADIALAARFARHLRRRSLIPKRHSSTASTVQPQSAPNYISPAGIETTNDDHSSHLNPSPDSYSSTPFIDHCTVTLHAGSGGHGCVSFLREKYIAAGPANGGDGGSGGSIYIQAVRGETSLHKLARRGILKAERGKNGQGKGQGGERGEGVLLTVPVGTVVREVWRHDPVAEEEERHREARLRGEEAGIEGDGRGRWRRDKWLLYPGSLPSTFANAEFPALPRPRRSNLTLTQPAAPIRLDLDTPMERPLLLAAGAMGGLGNPHFVTKSIPRPKFATRGEGGMRLALQLELKLLADVGLVGLPNAGKSTLLRALSNSRARVGAWAFTTLQPNIGTVVLDDYKGRPSSLLRRSGRTDEQRTSFTVADIPGLIEDAHLDKGLGLGFLRHIERAAVLAFVVDLAAGDAVAALKGLWNEVGEYETLRARELNHETERRFANEREMVRWKPFGSESPMHEDHDDLEDEGSAVLLEPSSAQPLPPLKMPSISAKPWFVVATKADLPETQENFAALQAYLKTVAAGAVEHPSGRENGWRRRMHAVPVSAIRAEGVGRIPEVVMDLLDD